MLKKRKRLESEESKGNAYGDNLFTVNHKGEQIDVEFELVQPSEAYYHSVRALLN